PRCPPARNALAGAPAAPGGRWDWLALLALLAPWRPRTSPGTQGHGPRQGPRVPAGLLTAAVNSRGWGRLGRRRDAPSLPARSTFPPGLSLTDTNAKNRPPPNAQAYGILDPAAASGLRPRRGECSHPGGPPRKAPPSSNGDFSGTPTRDERGAPSPNPAMWVR